MNEDWKPRAAELSPALEALHRAACRLLAQNVPDQAAERLMRADLGEWGNPAEIRLTMQPGLMATHRERAVLSYRLDGTVAAAGQARLFDGRALIDRQTYAVLDLALNVGPAVRMDR